MLPETIATLTLTREGMSTRELARVLKVPYPRALELRHTFQRLCRAANTQQHRDGNLQYCRSEHIQQWIQNCMTSVGEGCWVDATLRCVVFPTRRGIVSESCEDAITGQCRQRTTNQCRTDNAPHCRAASVKQCLEESDVRPDFHVDIHLFRDRDDHVAMGIWRTDSKYLGFRLAKGYPAIYRVTILYLDTSGKNWFATRPELLPIMAAPLGSKVTFGKPPSSLSLKGIDWVNDLMPGTPKTRLLDIFNQWRKKISHGKDHRNYRNLYAQEFAFRLNQAGKSPAAIQRILLDIFKRMKQ